MSVIFVFMHGVYEVNISKILAVTTLLLDDLCMKYCLVESGAGSRVSIVVLIAEKLRETWCRHIEN